jgi:anti-sigma regulatory factor (Ser/Thr protein kinase)
MSTDTSTRTDTGQRGYDHSAAYYASDDELLSVAVPFLLGGVAADEPTVVSLEPERSELVRAALPRPSDVTFLVTDDVYSRPAAAIRQYRELMAGLVAGGARGIRIFGEVPRAAIATAWDWWARYEAAVNHAYDEFPLRSMCAYDLRTTPREVLDDVARTHPFVAGPGGGHDSNDHYVDPPAFLAAPRPMTPYPVQLTPPVADLVDPTPAAARHAVVAADRGALPAAEVEDLVIAVSEVVTNALSHGRPPVRVRVWTAPDHTVVTVHDSGRGPTDPFAGLVPTDQGGFGLWLVHQLCAHVALHHDHTGFTVRLTAGHPRRGGEPDDPR